MAKKKDKPQVINNIQELNLEIDYDKLAQAIVKAKQIEEENVAEKKAADLEEWKRSLGVNKHEDKKGIKKKIYVFCNNVKVFFNLIFFSKKKKVRVSMTGAFMQSTTATFFHVIKVMLWILSLAFISVCVYHGNMAFDLLNYVYYIGFAIVAFMLASIFRLMAIETEQITDRERVLGIFTAVMSVMPMIEIIVSFFKEVG
ncbi:MAG: hypothetical protein E7549_04185 [Ruminococcaceae bacterium]|nr:hypothetical protein [Oscillospiraceae bacterium]